MLPAESAVAAEQGHLLQSACQETPRPGQAQGCLLLPLLLLVFHVRVLILVPVCGESRFCQEFRLQHGGSLHALPVSWELYTELCSLFAFREVGVILGCKRASELCSCCVHRYGDIPCLLSLLTAWQHWHKAQGPCSVPGCLHTVSRAQDLAEVQRGLQSAGYVSDWCVCKFQLHSTWLSVKQMSREQAGGGDCGFLGASGLGETLQVASLVRELEHRVWAVCSDPL